MSEIIKGKVEVHLGRDKDGDFRHEYHGLDFLYSLLLSSFFCIESVRVKYKFLNSGFVSRSRCF